MALLLALALLAVQWLGLVHRVVHGPASAGQRLALHVAHHEGSHWAPAGHDHDHECGTLASLFDDHDDTDCRLIDAAGQHAAPAPHLPTVPVLSPACGPHRLAHGEAAARWAALFDARGPPPAVS